MSFQEPDVSPPGRPAVRPIQERDAGRPLSRAEQRESTRQALLETAANEFAAKGYAAANLAEIAERVGVTRGLLHFYFRTKRDLALEIIAEFDQSWPPILDELSKWSGTYLEALKWLSRATSGLYQTSAVFRASVRLAYEPGLGDVGIAKSFTGWQTFTADLINKGKQVGEFRADLNVNATASTLISAYSGIHLTGSPVTGDVDISARIEYLWEVLDVYMIDPAKRPD